jgi:hypothetical protein
VLDYKSGTRTLEHDAYYEQASCYALVGLTEGYPQVETVFIRPEVSIDGRPEILRYTFTTDDREKIKERIITTIHEMEANFFISR